MDEDQSLACAFDKFRSNQRSLAGALTDTQQVFAALDRLVSGLNTNVNTQELLLSSEDVEEVKRVLKEPEILFCGQTKSGKSSLINELLGATVVECLQSPCTARIVQLCFADSPLIELIKPNGDVEKVYHGKNRIPEGLTNLVEEDRNKSEKTKVKVVAHLNIPFLRSGVKIVDSPGLSENPELNKLLDEHIEGVLPLVVYVIDGRNELSGQDVIDIGRLYRSVPQGNVFFAVTKCDKPEEDESEDEDEDAEAAEEKREETPEEFEEEIRNTVYEKLVENGFLPPNVPVQQCSRYHTLSSHKIKAYRHGDFQDEEDFTRYWQSFQSFKSCLSNFAGDQLATSVERAAKIIRASATKCLDYFVDYSSQICVQKMETRQSLQRIQQEEEILYTRNRDAIKRSETLFVQQVESVLSKNKANILRICYEIQIDDYRVPENERVSKKAVKDYQKTLNKKALGIIGDLIHRQVMMKCGSLDDLLLALIEDVKAVQVKIGEQIPLCDSLHGLLISKYSFDIGQVKLTKSLWKSVKNFVRKCTTAFTNHSVGSARADVLAHKRDLVKNLVEHINPETVAEALVDGILAHLDNGHNAFSSEIGNVWELVERKNRLRDADREAVRTMTPELGRILLKSLDIIDRFRFGEIDIGKDKIGGGAEGEIRDCDATGPNGQGCVVKLIYVNSQAQLGDHGMEIYFTRKLCHRNILNVYGIRLNSILGGCFQLLIIMPKLLCDLHSAFKENSVVHLRDRLVIAQQIAEAVEYMHKLFIIHRDIKLQNILLGPDNQVYLCDFGFTKAIGLTSDSLVGTPVHISPEIILIRNHSAAADVFAFGVLLWYICEGNGNQPSFVTDRTFRDEDGVRIDVAGVLQDAVVGLRPERLPNIPDECWNLMQRCWERDASRRPTMTEIVDALDTIVQHLLQDIVHDLL